MGVKLNDLRLEELRNEIMMTSLSGLPMVDEEGNAVVVKIFNPVGHRRLELIEKLQESQERIDNGNFTQEWYGYLLETLTDLEMDDTNIDELFESPKVEFNLIRKEIEAILNEIYVEQLISQISQMNNIKTTMYTDLMLKKVAEIEQIAKEIKEIDPEYGLGGELVEDANTTRIK